MLRKSFLLLIFFISSYAYAQQSPAVIDSFKLQLSKAKDYPEKIEILSRLSRLLMNVNRAEADKYGVQMTQEAELSRDRKLIVKALLANGERFSYFAAKKEEAAKAIDYYNQGLQLARQNRLDKEVAQALLALSAIHMTISELEKAPSYTTQASAIVSTIKNDSMQSVVYNSLGNVYQLKKERLLALRNYLNALRGAEEIKNNDLMRKSYSNLSAFYADVKEYDKAIDFAAKALEKLSPSKPNARYSRVTDLNYIGNLYSLKKNFDMSVYYYEQSLKLADSLKFDAMKVPAYVSILNQYITANQPQKALDYFNTNPELRKYIYDFGFPYVIDQAYAVIYTDLKRFDSAQYFFDKAAPQFETIATPANRLGFYIQFANFYKKSGNYKAAIETYLKAKALADQTANLEWQQNIAKDLDTVYNQNGNVQQSYYFSSLYHQYKDSLEKLGEEKDVMQMELADEQQRQERIAKEAAAALQRKHNVQYMGIAVAIAIVFLLLVLLGIFHVSATTIRVLGFFAFIFLFEFIILIADAKIHHWTHGEPLPILGIKIVLIAMLLPLHHWLEHKVVSYLASKRMILPSGKSFWTKVLAKRATRSVQ